MIFLKEIYIKFNKVRKVFLSCHLLEEDSHLVQGKKKHNALATKAIGWTALLRRSKKGRREKGEENGRFFLM